MKRRILVGASWKSGSTSSPESSRLVLVTLSRMPSLQESSGTISYTVGCRKALQEQKGAYTPHSHLIILFIESIYDLQVLIQSINYPQF